jgi:hypothetical protein
MAKLIDLPLSDLYNRPKITPAVKSAIIQKEDFSQISTSYCNKVCTLKCKTPDLVLLNHTPVDILIIQDHRAFTEGFYTGDEINQIHSNIINYLAIKHFSKLSYRTTNLTKCEIKGLDINKGKAPAQTVLRRCAPYLLEEIRRANPKVIISLTTAVTKELGFSTVSNTANRGEIHSNDFVSNVVITLHPKVTTMIRQNSSGQMWGTDFLEVIDRDFEKASRLARGALVVPKLADALERYSKHIKIARSISEVVTFTNILSNLPSTSVISFDLETTGLDPFSNSAKIITAQFGYRTAEGYIEALVIPLWHRENTWFHPHIAWEYIAKILLNPDIKKVGHNIKFDVLYTMCCTGVRIQGIVFDTMLILHNINSGLNKNYGLKRAVWDWIPHTGLGGYEDKLPKLTKLVNNNESEDEIDE